MRLTVTIQVGCCREGRLTEGLRMESVRPRRSVDLTFGRGK